MIRRMKLPIWMALAALAACGGGGGGVQLPEGAVVDKGPFESYRTDHNGHERVRLDRSTSADAAVIAGFEDADPADPAGYRNLIDLAGSAYEGKMIIEVIGEVETASGYKAKRILRLTTDQAPFENVQNGRLVTATGKYYFKGESFAWVTIGNGPVLSGHHSQGLEKLELDFDNGTASIEVRTEVAGDSEVEIGFSAKGLPFNIVTGAYGGDITIAVRNPDVTETYSVDGYLRGNVGGSPTYTDGIHGMSTSGVFTSTGEAAAGQPAITVDGVYFGVHEQALPNAVP